MYSKQMSLKEEAEKLLNTVAALSDDIHHLPKENLENRIDSLNVSKILGYPRSPNIRTQNSAKLKISNNSSNISL